MVRKRDYIFRVTQALPLPSFSGAANHAQLSCRSPNASKFAGPSTVGVFRVSSSKRRVRQLRELFDSGSDQVEKLLGVNGDPSLDSSDSGDESR